MNTHHVWKTTGQVRRGNVLVLAATMMIALAGMVAFAVDVGYLQVARVELQRTADSAAIAATWELAKSESGLISDTTWEYTNARTKAVQYAAANPVLTAAPVVNSNTSNASNGDVVIGQLLNWSNPASTLNTSAPYANAVQVRVRKTAGSSNGSVPLFFARALGIASHEMEATATAALMNNFGGFQAPADGSNLEMLPFALDKDTWDALMAGGGTDQWHWNPDTKTVTSGSDGVREVNLYPQGTNSPGNRGTVDIGGSNNSTSDIARQIVDGISPQDLQDLGHPLEFNNQGELSLNGDTGISAGVKDELASIIGKPRIIPIFDHVCGPGNNANYTIVEFAGIRIVDVSLTGKMSNKRVIIQPAKIFARGGVPSSGPQKSWYVYSPAWLVR